MPAETKLGNGWSIRLRTKTAVWRADVFRRGEAFEVVGDGIETQIAPCRVCVDLGSGISAVVHFRDSGRKSPPMLVASAEFTPKGAGKLDALRPTGGEMSAGVI